MSKEAIIRLNPKQLLFHQTVTANQADYLKEGVGYQGGFRATFQGGRGSGKSRTLIHLLAESAFQLPRAKAGLAGLTFRQVQDIILSQSSSVFEEHGLHEYNSKTGFGHYVINRRPPEHWKSAWNTIRTYDNSLVFANGYTVQFVSADRPETIRGANFDQLLIDESATIKEEFYNKVLRPTVRANKHIYKDARPGRKGLNHPLHWLIADFTSVPWTPQGNWIFKTEELQKEKPGRYYFQEATAYDNLEFLPGSFIEDQREACGDELTFNMEILNQRLTRVGSGFYHSLDTARHVYPQSFSYEYDDLKRLYVHRRTDYDPNAPIESSWDFNAEFTSMLVCQDARSEYRFIDVLFVKTAKDTSMVEKLAADFADKYKDHKRKVIHIYGDNGANKKDAGRNKTYFELLKAVLKKAGWTVVDQVQSAYPAYHVRYRVINGLLQETNIRLPKIRINETACKSLLISLQSAPIDGTTFEKIKLSERNKALPQEYATHLSDCFDYILFKKFSAYVTGSGVRTGGIVIR
ncbi:terminase large subunit domain-containing protein [Rudanella lutea]|uniref:terminase large subunit domain-containing protein n=1 Tax=Rudanella lutea TaxID=451374 RepID=UPI00036DE4D3|nr:terminase family protein [Rudanella lutea]